MKRSSSMTAIFALGAGVDCIDRLMAGKLYHRASRLTEVVARGVQYATAPAPPERARCAGAEGLQSRAGVPVVPRRGDRVARDAAARRARARSARHQLEALGGERRP